MKVFQGTRYANVTATMALVVALGGTSYAAIKLPKNSVGNKQIKSNAVTSAKIKNGSLRPADFGSGQLPAGAKGADGAPGAPGAPGEKGTAKAYAAVKAWDLKHPLVDAPDPVFIGPHPGFAAVTRGTTDGLYCLKAEPGVVVHGVSSSATYLPIDSRPVGVVGTVPVDPGFGFCDDDTDLTVQTFDASPSDPNFGSLGNAISFTVIVP